MYCKHCGSRLPDNKTLCQSCGKENMEPKKKSVPMIVIASLCLLVLLALLGAMIYYGVYGTLKLPSNDLYYRDNYTVSDDKMIAKADKVVATMGECELTNSQLQVFYWMQVYNYGSYYSISKDVPLSEQVMNKTTGMSYQQYFLDCALINWQQLAMLADMADKDSWKLSEDYQKMLDDLQVNTLANAVSAGFTTVEEYLLETFGPGVTFEDYYYYYRTYYVGNLYFSDLVDAVEVTDEALEKFFAANKDNLVTDWKVKVTKDMGNVVDVRHVLISPTDTDKDGKVSDDEWEACRVKAQGLYDQWLAGKADEETFYDLAVDYSEDSNYYYGGLYEGVTPGVMVEAFNDWCFAEGRKAGDHGLVKTDYGYHIMYFVGIEDGWVRYCTDGYLSSVAATMLEELSEENSAEINFKAIVLSDVEL